MNPKGNLCMNFSHFMSYKAYKYLFDTIRKKFKRAYYFDLFAKYKNDIKVINEVIRNKKYKRKYLLEKLVINNTTAVEKQDIAENLGRCFTSTDINLKSEIPNKEILKIV